MTVRRKMPLFREIIDPPIPATSTYIDPGRRCSFVSAGGASEAMVPVNVRSVSRALESQPLARSSAREAWTWRNWRARET